MLRLDKYITWDILTSGSDHKAQELDLLSVEQALLRFGVQVILAKTLQATSEMKLMIFQ